MRGREERAERGSVQKSSMFEYAGAIIRTSTGPSPATWYAMCVPSADLA